MSENLIVEYHFYEEKKGEMETPEGKWVEWAAGKRSHCFPGEHGEVRLMVPFKGADLALIKRLMLDARTLFRGPKNTGNLLDEFLLAREVPTVKGVHFLPEKGFVFVAYNSEVVGVKVAEPYFTYTYEKEGRKQ